MLLIEIGWVSTMVSQAYRIFDGIARFYDNAMLQYNIVFASIPRVRLAIPCVLGRPRKPLHFELCHWSPASY